MATSKHRTKTSPSSGTATHGATRRNGSILLDAFTEEECWRAVQVYSKFRSYHHQLFAELEGQRRSRYDELKKSLLDSSCSTHQIKGWNRIVDYSRSDDPLSARGYLFGVGGRFNYGVELDPAHFEPFPALYIADSHQTAFAEKYHRDTEPDGILKLNDFELMPPSPHSNILFDGRLKNIFDLRNHKNLKKFAKIISEFQTSQMVAELAQEAGIKPYDLIRTPKKLWKSLREAHWIRYPRHLDLPSNSQVFGKCLRDAGFEGVVYRSVRIEAGLCMALFVENFEKSESFLEVQPPAPKFVKNSRLDAHTYKILIS